MENINPEIVFVTSEIYPFSKSGGLADVLGILPLTLHRMGLNVAVFTPLYGRIATGQYPFRLVYENCLVGYPWPNTCADVYLADYEGMPVYFIDRGEYFDRRHYYCTPKGDYFDNCERFIFFNRAVLEATRALGFHPKVFHAHDWHTALLPVYVYFRRQTDPYWANIATVLTIHNLAFQGRFSFRLFEGSGLPYDAWNMDGVEFYNSFNMLKGGIMYADRVTTVSPSYAKEILTPEFGCGLEGSLRARSGHLAGILNGADYSIWSPEEDLFLSATYSRKNMAGKARCKEALIRDFSFSPGLSHRPVLGFIGRLREQKGIDLLLEILPELVARDLLIVVLGEGDPGFESRLLEMVERFPGRVGAYVGYTEEMSHRILSGCDIFLMPSRYEPCGLTQMYSLRYGAVPVATAVGGLRDTIVPYPNPRATGFVFSGVDAGSFLGGIEQALRVWEQPEEWERIRSRGMACDFSWGRSAEEYIYLYRELLSSNQTSRGES